MNLYHVSRKTDYDWDNYSDFVICSKTSEDAANTNPDGTKGLINEPYNSWVSSTEDVTVTFLGKANKKIKVGVICASFHAG